MNGWRSRALLAAIFYAAAKAHDFAMQGIGNSDEWLFLYHGSAAAVDLMLLQCCPRLLEGKICDDIQATCIASIAVNALAWGLYLAYAPPVICNTLIAGLCYVQFVRLLYVDRHDADTVGRALLRGLAGGRSQFHHQEAHS